MKPHTHAPMHAHTHIHTYTHTHAHMHMHTHTHTCTVNVYTAGTCHDRPYKQRNRSRTVMMIIKMYKRVMKTLQVM